MSDRPLNLITIIPAPADGNGYVPTRGTKVLAGDDTEIHGIRRIRIEANVDDVWQVDLASYAALPPILSAQLRFEDHMVGRHVYPFVLWEGRTYSSADLAQYAAAHADACLSEYIARTDRERAKPKRWEQFALAGWFVFGAGAALLIATLIIQL